MWKYLPTVVSVCLIQACQVAKADGLRVVEKETSARTDQYGDPLPPGGVARLGTVRFHHEGRISAMAFSPDGNSIVAACSEKEGLSLRIWETTTGKELSRFKVNESVCYGLAFTPDGKGVMFYYATPKMYDSATGKLLRSFQGVGHAYAYDLSPDGRMLATQVYVGPDYLIHVWDAANGQELKRLAKQSGSPLGLKFSSDSTRLMSANDSGGICIWETASGKMLRQITKKIQRVALARDGWTAAVVTDRGGTVDVVDVGTGKTRCQIDAEGSELIFTPDSKTLVSNRYFVSPILWDTSTGKLLRQLPNCPGHRVAGISGDGKLLATIKDGTADSSIMLWDLERGEPFHRTGGHWGTVTAVAFSPDGKLIASGGEEGMVRFWNADSSKEIGHIKAHRHRILAVAFAPNGKLLATIATHGTTRLWEVPSGRLANPDNAGVDFDGLAFSSRSSSILQFSPDGKKLTFSPVGGGIEFWDLADAKRSRPTVMVPEETCVVLGRDTLLTTSPISVPGTFFGGHGNLSLWRTNPFKPIRQLATGDNLACWAVAISADDRIIVSAHSVVQFNGRGGADANNHTIRLWERSTTEAITTIKGFRINTLEFSKDSRVFAAGHGNNHNWFNPEVNRDITLWNSVTGEKLHTLSGHADDIACLAFAPGSKRLASGSADGTVLIWDDLPNPQGKSPRAKVTDNQLEVYWKDLGGNAAVGYRASACLLQHPEQAVVLLGVKLKPAPPVDAKRIEKLVGELSSVRFVDREEAMKALAALGDQAEPALRKSLAGNPTLERRRRMESLLEQIDSAPLTAIDLQFNRGLALLEWINSPEARRLLAGIASGAPEARRTRLAQRVMGRVPEK